MVQKAISANVSHTHKGGAFFMRPSVPRVDVDLFARRYNP